MFRFEALANIALATKSELRAIKYNGIYYLGTVSRGKFTSYPLLDTVVSTKEIDNNIILVENLSDFKVLEFRTTERIALSGAICEITNKCNYCIDVSKSFENYLKSLKSKRRSQLLNIKSGYAFETIKNIDLINIINFYRIYLTNIRRLYSLPLSLDFFKKLLSSSSQSLVIHNVYFNGKLAAASIVAKNDISAHLLFASSLKISNENLFLYREMIKFYSDDPFVKNFYLGRSTKDSNNDSFKMHIGALQYPISKYYFHNGKQKTKRRGYLNFLGNLRFSPFFQNIYHLIPNFLLVLIGRFIYKMTPL